MIKFPGLYLLLALLCYTGQAQNWSLISRQKLEFPVELCNTDRLGHLYLIDSRGNLRKFDQAGQFVAQFASQHYGKVSMLESWTALRIFLFYQDIQQYVFLDRFLNQSEFMEFPQGLFGLLILASPSNDNQLWVVDSGPLNLIKFDPTFGTITFSQPLNQFAGSSDLKYYQLLEYQNRVYLGDEDSGILVFDNLGNYLHKLDKIGSERFFPLGKEVYFLRKNKLHFVSLYDQNQRIVELPDNQTRYLHAQLTDKTLVLVSEQELFVYNHSPR